MTTEIPSSAQAGSMPAAGLVPGEVLSEEGTVTLYAGLAVVTLKVFNLGDRPVQVGSHFHFAETNAALDFDRAAARGTHLAIAAGTSVRFEPGITRVVELVGYTGDRIVAGFRGEIGGPLDG